MTGKRSDGTGDLYIRACNTLGRGRTRAGPPQSPYTLEKEGSDLVRNIELSRLPLDAERIERASWAVAAIAAVTAAILAIWAVISSGMKDASVFILLAVVVPFLAREVFKSYPRVLSRRVANEVVRGSTSAVNLMIMSLRREASLSAAIAFSSKKNNCFTEELKRCTWGVIMGRYASFEEALQALGERWSRTAGELKTAINSMITASCEATEDGRRRALDRANNASVMGVKRRIEEYALSLSTPSMIMFGLAILLPLMVGSFIPMMSWDSLSGVAEEPLPTSGQMGIGLLQVVFVMNILFPAIGLLIALSSITRHPLEPKNATSFDSPLVKRELWTLAVLVSLLLISLSVLGLAGTTQSIALLLSGLAPVAILLIYLGARGAPAAHETAEGSEELLFRTGARMVEGENFEGALNSASKELEGALGSRYRSVLLANGLGQDLQPTLAQGLSGAESQALEAFQVVMAGAAKDERAAGFLAMDLAMYARDLREIERSLQSRLKPTISMMKITSYVLAPIVLGITFAMYMTLGAIAGEGNGLLDPAGFFLILGAFLAESGAVVQYFIWGVEGKRNKGLLATSVGTCVLLSELIFIASALIAV